MDEARLIRYIPEIRDFITPKCPPDKLNADDYPSLTDEEKDIVRVISSCVEERRELLREEHYIQTEKNGFFGKNTNQFEFLKWEELFLKKGILEKVSKASKTRQKEILKLAIEKLYPEEPHLIIIKQLLKEKSTPDKRKNELHTFLMRVIKTMEGRKTSAKEDWREIKINYERYDTDNIIQEVTDGEICWISSHGHEDTMSWSTFQKERSKLRAKINEEKQK
ncbi:MAG: hypothetical protein R3E93_08760 [Thiothrix sp.]